MTSSEIVKALRCCATDDESICDNCPTRREEVAIDCSDYIKTEAADLIERLEKEKAALLAQVKWRCDLCKNFSGNGTRKRCWGTSDCSQRNVECLCRGCDAGSKWTWKGPEDNDGQIDK